MIKILHEQVVEALYKTTESIDNGTNKTLRNVLVNTILSIEDFNISEDIYTRDNGLVDIDNDEHKDKNFSFLKQEWSDWKNGVPKGESLSQFEYPEHWKGAFDNYCYSDRFGKYLENQIENIRKNPESRQNILSIWTKDDEFTDGKMGSVPCTISYSVQLVKGIAYFTFVYRSVETTNFVNDLFLNKEYIKHILAETDITPDSIDVTYFIHNLHEYPRKWER